MAATNAGGVTDADSAPTDAVLPAPAPGIADPPAMPGVTLRLAVRVGTRVSLDHVRRGRVVRFSGRVGARAGAPVRDPAQHRDGGWRTIAGSVTRGDATTSSVFAQRIRVRRTARYRVFVQSIDGDYVSGVGGRSACPSGRSSGPSAPPALGPLVARACARCAFCSSTLTFASA